MPSTTRGSLVSSASEVSREIVGCFVVRSPTRCASSSASRPGALGERGLHHVLGDGAQIPDGADVEALERAARALTDAGQEAQRQVGEERGLLAALDLHRATGLGQRERDARDGARAADADRDVEARGLAHGGVDRRGGGQPRTMVALTAAEVEEGLVEGERLDLRREPPEHVQHLPRGPHVGGVVAVQEHGLAARAAPGRFEEGHAGVHPEAPGLVGRRSHHAALAGQAAHDHRAAPERRVAHPLDGHVEAVQVDEHQVARTGAQRRRG